MAKVLTAAWTMRFVMLPNYVGARK
ncbi:hypothetical protein CCACVL1_01773 [Corchorus capsularis]|uniref:Uncharacterized protein n=1 Tax=Corchorus capsularis TaxID=210143 RepID=A0A1R3KFT6_COCAP|nr:hypothetical protein CCACVL1_01773 [Corchorus capsularis]